VSRRAVRLSDVVADCSKSERWTLDGSRSRGTGEERAGKERFLLSTTFSSCLASTKAERYVKSTRGSCDECELRWGTGVKTTRGREGRGRAPERRNDDNYKLCSVSTAAMSSSSTDGVSTLPDKPIWSVALGDDESADRVVVSAVEEVGRSGVVDEGVDADCLCVEFLPSLAV
jgi:hypothetical protein